MYIMTVDNLPARWGAHGTYIGLSGFSGGQGVMFMSFFGGGLVDEAAFYYDDPQYRWLARNGADIKWSRGSGWYAMHADTVDEAVKPEIPATYDAVRAFPFDERFYGVLNDPRSYYDSAEGDEMRPPPEPFEKAADRVAFRDGFDAQRAYLHLATSQALRIRQTVQNNSIAGTPTWGTWGTWGCSPTHCRRPDGRATSCRSPTESLTPRAPDVRSRPCPTTAHP
jgi:hypothetical protein